MMKRHDHAEYVSPGHPDRLADAISNSIVDFAQASATSQPNRSLVGIEVAVHDGTVFIDGRIARPAGAEPPGFRSLVKEVFAKAGYDKSWGPDPEIRTTAGKGEVRSSGRVRVPDRRCPPSGWGKSTATSA